jgi:purine-nucleoside phosphorylase
MSTYDDLQTAAAFVRQKIGDRSISIGMILGSGLGAYAETLENPVFIDYAEIPGFPSSTVQGHAGRLVIGEKAGLGCAAMQGRVHFYEGHSLQTAVFPARTLITLGAKTLLITNAAGGLEHPPGTLMVIRDHLNLFPENPLRGENDERLGPRFPDMTRAYAPELRELAHRAAESMDLELGEGVYAGLPGPAYETPAEVRMLKTLGASAAGMSTVPEVIAANHMGARVLGISCITNKAAGLSDQALSHDEVTETASRIRDTFVGLLDAILRELAKEPT